MSLTLAHKHFGGSGRPIVILHGLFGSHKNWAGVAAKLVESDVGAVYGLDLRNHGESPHGPTHTFQDLVEDLRAWLKANDISEPVVVGHSMGGLTAMGYALENPAPTAGLVVVDIAPRAYEPHHSKEFEALEMDVSGFKSRGALDQAMAAIIAEPMTRQFLQMNLAREGDGYRWKINVPVLKNSTYINEFQGTGSWDGPSLFFAGGRSDYVAEADHARIKELFPSSRLEFNPDADHWLHYTAADWFVPKLIDFIKSL